jgi:predicted HD superfamily hydrolase involved in NAD metabolism
MEKHSHLVDAVSKRISGPRFDHTMGVIGVATDLALEYGESVENAFLAALFHDYSKYISHDEAVERSKFYGIELDGTLLRHPKLLHGHIAAEEAREQFGIDSESILDAVRYHTFGREHMKTLDKIIYIADAVEPMRQYEGVDEIRDALGKSLDRALLMSVESTIIHVVKKGFHLHIGSVLMRNRLIFELSLKL